MTFTPTPSFRWSLLAFVAISAVILVAAIGLLILLDPRSQAWWGDQFSAVGSFFRSLLPH